MLFWEPLWWPEFFSAPYTDACPWCSFTADRSQLQRADGVLFSVPELKSADKLGQFPDRKPPGQQWVYMCVEAGGEYPCFLQLPPRSADRPSERRKHGGVHADKFDLWAGHHGCADVPALYPMPSAAQMLAPARVSFAHKLQLEPVSYMSSNCREERDEWVAQLMAVIGVASYGRCLHNQHGEDAGGRTYGPGARDKMATMGRHRFTIAHEGFWEPWYFSEKLWDPFIAGSVPVFVGHTAELHAEGLLPEGSWIDASRFGSVEALGAHLKKLGGDQELYESYFQWKQKPLPEGWLRAQRNTWSTVACRMCDKLPGLGS